jgi:myosin heavy subunit
LEADSSSGESGSGKTETSKYLLTYLTSAGSSKTDAKGKGDRDSIMDRILQSNPILEAFGNAKTMRNNNSSRFGKFIKLAFDRKGKLAGGTITVYLLENFRVVNQLKGDQNFHIFYQMIAGASEQEREEWNLSGDTSSYNYLLNQDMTEDLYEMYAESFQKLRQNFEDLELEAEAIEMIFSVMAGLLHFGQITFQPSFEGGEEGSVVSDYDALESAAALCGFSADEIEQAVTYRSVQSRGEEVTPYIHPLHSHIIHPLYIP